MKIAIIDDNIYERKNIINLVENYFATKKNNLKVALKFKEFENGETFMEDFAPNEYEIIFLDIYMGKLTGIDVAKHIATVDKKCNIILFTTSDAHLLDGYSVHAIGYVMKPVEKSIDALYNALDYAVENLQLDTASITLPAEHCDICLYFKDILYIDCINRSVYVHLIDKNIKICGKISDYRKPFLEDKRFLECYRDVLVNMDFIDTPDDNDLILKTSERLPISRRKKALVLEKYMMYFLKKRGS